MYSFVRYAGSACLVATAVTAAGCYDFSPVEVHSLLAPEGVRYELVAGDQQSALAGSQLPEPLVVRVTSATGEAIAGQIVNWIVTGGGGSVFAGRALTNAEGIAQEWWTLGDSPGANSLEVRAVDSSTGEALVFARFAATGLDGTESEPAPPPPSTISLSVMGYKVKGLQKVDLTWSGATVTSVEVHRDGVRLVETPNDGSHLDPIDQRGGGTYLYRLCESGGTVCSGELQITF